MSLFNEPTVFLKLEVSNVLAPSPIALAFGVKETSEGVARFDTSLVRTSIPLLRAVAIFDVLRVTY